MAVSEDGAADDAGTECLSMVVLLMPNMLTIATVMLWLDRKATTQLNGCFGWIKLLLLSLLHVLKV